MVLLIYHHDFAKISRYDRFFHFPHQKNRPRWKIMTRKQSTIMRMMWEAMWEVMRSSTEYISVGAHVGSRLRLKLSLVSETFAAYLGKLILPNVNTTKVSRLALSAPPHTRNP